jgi:hypothetical protein
MGATPAGWYPDPDDPALFRFWDGASWTDSRCPAVADPNEPAAPSVAAASGRSGSPRLAAARRIADTARQSPIAQRVADGASAVGRGVVATAKDPARRQAAVRAAAPALDAALDATGVRNKDGKVKIWRLARAAARPRKTVSRAGRGVAVATAGVLRSTGAGSVDRQHGRLAPRDAEIVAEWVFDDPGQDLTRWREGLARFAEADRSDTAELRASAYLMCDVLKSCVIGDPIVEDDNQIIETVGNVLAALLHGAADDWQEDDEKVVRLALAVARRFGVQPEELGGNGELDALFYDSLDRMRMAMSIAQSKWSCDLSAWFADTEAG